MLCVLRTSEPASLTLSPSLQSTRPELYHTCWSQALCSHIKQQLWTAVCDETNKIIVFLDNEFSGFIHCPPANSCPAWAPTLGYMSLSSGSLQFLWLYSPSTESSQHRINGIKEWLQLSNISPFCSLLWCKNHSQSRGKGNSITDIVESLTSKTIKKINRKITILHIQIQKKVLFFFLFPPMDCLKCKPSTEFHRSHVVIDSVILISLCTCR